MSTMKSIVKVGVFTFAAMFAFAAVAAPNITITSVVQRWPWNNKVDINYTVGDGQDVSEGRYYRIVFTAVVDDTTTYEIDGVTNIAACAATGSHTATWTAPAGIKTDNFKVSARLYNADVPSGDDYLVIDLASGAYRYEGLYASQDASNARYNDVNDVSKSDEYKVNKLVMRKVPLGSYAGYADNTWQVNKHYYLGIFPVTQGQYKKVTSEAGFNNWRNSVDTSTVPNDYANYRPAEKDNVYWNKLRSSLPATNALPANASGSFLQRIAARTGLDGFDLPTEAMLEIGMRAGTTTKYYWGASFVGDNVVYKDNFNRTVPVGYKPSNGWGFYDMIGNVRELCRDDDSRTNDDKSALSDPFVPAWSGESNSRRVLCGAYDFDSSWFNAPPTRQSNNASSGNNNVGFRAAYIPQ